MLDATTEIGLPTTITIGDTITFTESLTDYTSAEYTLSYIFSNSISLEGVADGDGWTITVLPTTFEKSSVYDFAIAITKISDSSRLILNNGSVRVLEDPADLPTDHDARTHARRTLEAIQAVIEGRATVDQDELYHRWQVSHTYPHQRFVRS